MPLSGFQRLIRTQVIRTTHGYWKLRHGMSFLSQGQRETEAGRWSRTDCRVTLGVVATKVSASQMASAAPS